MILPSHLVAAQAVYLGACLATDTPGTPGGVGIAFLASLLPDLDKADSLIGRIFPFISRPLEYFFGHRTVTHSLPLQAIVSLGVYLGLGWGVFLAVASGWASHSLADMMTARGVCWFWPSTVRCVMPGNERYRMASMGWGEFVFLCLMGLSSVFLLHLNQDTKGSAGVITASLGVLDSARREYDAEKGAHAFTLKLTGRDNRTHAQVEGEFPVIGHYRESGFIVEAGGVPRSACRETACDIHVDHAVLTQGEAIQTTTRTVQAQSLELAKLVESLKPLGAAGEVYLVGSFQALHAKHAPPGIETAGETVSLNYAKPEALLQGLPAVVTAVDITVQVRHAPGGEIPEIELRPTPNGLDPLLDRWAR